MIDFMVLAIVMMVMAGGIGLGYGLGVLRALSRIRELKIYVLEEGDDDDPERDDLPAVAKDLFAGEKSELVIFDEASDEPTPLRLVAGRKGP